jgi:hypothetical protein
MTQHPAPGTVVRHFLALEMKKLAQFMCAQLGPMRHGTTAILTSQFRQDPTHEQTGQGVLQPTSIPMIRNGLQTGIQRLQVKHQRLLGKRECTQLCCIVQRKTFHEEHGIVSSMYTPERSLLFPIPDLATALVG